MCEPGEEQEDEVGPSLAMARANHAEVLRLNPSLPISFENALLRDSLEAARKERDTLQAQINTATKRLDKLEARFEQFRDEVKGGRW